MKETNWLSAPNFSNWNENTVNQDDLQELKEIKTRKIVFTENKGKFKKGDILEVKIMPNKHSSEPSSFLIVEEKIGSSKMGFGGRGYKPFFEDYKEQSNAEKENKNLKLASNSPKEPLFYVLVTIGVLTLGYFAYNKLKK